MRDDALAAAIRKANGEGRCGRIPYVTGGFPTPHAFWDVLSELCDNGADIVEIGVPFSDPVADGPVVAEAGRRALEEGVTLRWLLEGLSRRKFSAPLVLMSYANPLVQYGWAEAAGAAAPGGGPYGAGGVLPKSLGILASAAKAASVAGAIVPDLPLEESGPFREAFSAEGIDLIPLVGPNTGAARMKEYLPSARGYVYVVSVLGITGMRKGLPPEAEETLKRARQVFDIPLALGFGIKEPSQLDGIASPPDAVIFGSALLRHLADGGSAKDFMAPWISGS
ncbi:MAG: tryptophan synthase subunit alpha [Deltaproteobacteria bacterium]|jgi:tryptophan synthase alpha chain|nr:tryptophan synthase subunit alpha [Deltaproteobacteria bacterium]